MATIPYNFYALLSLIMVFVIACTGLDFGPMARAEARARKGTLGNIRRVKDDVEPSDQGTIFEMAVPVIALIVFAVLGLMYSGGYWGKDPKYHGFVASLGNASASKALVWLPSAPLPWLSAVRAAPPRDHEGFPGRMH